MRVLIVLAALAKLSCAAVAPRQAISPSQITVTSTYASTVTNTITTAYPVTTVATTCSAGSKVPSGATCSDGAVYSLTGGNYYSQQCSASLVGGTVIRAYVEPVGAAATSICASFCNALNNIHTPASSCNGIVFTTIGALYECFLQNGPVTAVPAAGSVFAIQQFTTNPCVTTVVGSSIETLYVTTTTAYEVVYTETVSAPSSITVSSSAAETTSSDATSTTSSVDTPSTTTSDSSTSSEASTSSIDTSSSSLASSSEISSTSSTSATSSSIPAATSSSVESTTSSSTLTSISTSLFNTSSTVPTTLASTTSPISSSTISSASSGFSTPLITNSTTLSSLPSSTSTPFTNSSTTNPEPTTTPIVSPPVETTPPVYITETVSEYTTYCPGPTSVIQGNVTYTVTDATTLTISDCPCTVSYLASTVPTFVAPSSMSLPTGFTSVVTSTSAVAMPSSPAEEEGDDDCIWE